MPKTVVIIGASFAGLKAIRYLATCAGINVIIINPDKKLYFKVAAPRLLVQPELFDKAVVDLEDELKALKHKFIVGTVTSVQPDSNALLVSTGHGEEKVSYDFLIVASGTKAYAEWVGSSATVEESKNSVKETAAKLKNSKTIAIVGGGPTGVETAGEIAYKYRDATVDLYTGDGGVLGITSQKRQRSAAEQLKKLGVNVFTNTYVSDISETSLSIKGQVKSYDVVINATVMKPNTSFLPSELLDSKGYLVVDNHLISKTHKNILGFGDVCSITDKTLIDMQYIQTKVFKSTVDHFILGKPNKPKEYAKAGSTTIVIPISPVGGVGEAFGWGLPGFMVKMKSKDFFLHKIKDML